MLLQPIFRDLKSMIKHQSLTEEYKLVREFVHCRNAIHEHLPKESSRSKDGVKELQVSFAKLLNNYRAQMQTPSNAIKLISKRLEDIF